ncbi:MAG: oligopeptide transporter, OPT family [Myxococcota bacterium]|jgi:putative OPT family oligopeptide transporter|nr:oligopeptide transporter, OPT family [Myxococcota bacterium]
MDREGSRLSLPANAHRELAPGEVYRPVIPPDTPCPEVTRRSVVAGIAMTIFFSAAVAYLTLKIGQGLEAAIPISILAIGLATLFKRRSTLLENVNIVAIGATSGIVVGGSLFVMPAISILGLDRLSSFFQIFFVPLLGAVLGVLLLIPFRRYFVAKMHGKLPFPEATACTEVLVTGEQGGSQAKVLLKAMGLGALYDGSVLVLGLWRENFTTAAIGACDLFTHKLKAVFSLNTTAAIAGLGYLIGVRYAAIILAGSFFSCFVIVPLLAWIGGYLVFPVGLGLPHLADMPAEDIFYNYARYIGIGGIFAAGLISILKMLPVMLQAFAAGFREIALLLRRRGQGPAAGATAPPRTDQDIPMAGVLGGLLLLLAVIFLYFRYGVMNELASPWLLAAVAVGVAFLITLLFSAVSAWAVAMISVTPISGMTLMTLLITAMILSQLGLTGDAGMLAVLLVGGVVCTGLSMSGTLITEFKMSYWLGATPRRVQWSNILGSVVAALIVTAVMLLLAETHGFVKSDLHPHPLPAPQANAMADVLRTILSAYDPTKLYLYGLGAAVAVIIELLGVSSLAFALGMYIPMEYNSPIIVGALVAHFVRRSGGKDKPLGEARYNRGILISSGLIAGGALIGVLSAIPKLFEQQEGELVPVFGFAETSAGNLLGLLAFLALCGYIGWDARRATARDAGPSLG